MHCSILEIVGGYNSPRVLRLNANGICAVIINQESVSIMYTSRGKMAARPIALNTLVQTRSLPQHDALPRSCVKFPHPRPATAFSPLRVLVEPHVGFHVDAFRVMSLDLQENFINTVPTRLAARLAQASREHAHAHARSSPPCIFLGTW